MRWMFEVRGGHEHHDEFLCNLLNCDLQIPSAAAGPLPAPILTPPVDQEQGERRRALQPRTGETGVAVGWSCHSLHRSLDDVSTVWLRSKFVDEYSPVEREVSGIARTEQHCRARMTRDLMSLGKVEDMHRN